MFDPVYPDGYAVGYEQPNTDDPLIDEPLIEDPVTEEPEQCEVITEIQYIEKIVEVPTIEYVEVIKEVEVIKYVEVEAKPANDNRKKGSKGKRHHDDNGHGNDEGKFDPSNPGKKHK